MKFLLFLFSILLGPSLIYSQQTTYVEDINNLIYEKVNDYYCKLREDINNKNDSIYIDITNIPFSKRYHQLYDYRLIEMHGLIRNGNSMSHYYSVTPKSFKNGFISIRPDIQLFRSFIRLIVYKEKVCISRKTFSFIVEDSCSFNYELKGDKWIETSCIPPYFKDSLNSLIVFSLNDFNYRSGWKDYFINSLFLHEKFQYDSLIHSNSLFLNYSTPQSCIPVFLRRRTKKDGLTLVEIYQKLSGEIITIVVNPIIFSHNKNLNLIRITEDTYRYYFKYSPINKKWELDWESYLHNN